MNSLYTVPSLFPTLKKETQAQIINVWTNRLSKVEKVTSDILRLLDVYQRLINESDSGFGSKPEIYKRAVKHFSAAHTKAIEDFKLEQSGPAAVRAEINRSHLSASQLSSPAAKEEAAPSEFNQFLFGLRESTARAPCAPLQEYQVRQLMSESYRSQELSELARSLDRSTVWMGEAIWNGLRQYPESARAELRHSLQTEQSDNQAKRVNVWSITHLLRQCSGTRATDGFIPEHLKEFLDVRPAPHHRTLRELMIEFAKPENCVDALSAKEKANIVLSAQLLTPPLFGPEYFAFVQNIEEIAEAVAGEMAFIPPAELINLLNMHSFDARRPLVESLQPTPSARPPAPVVPVFDPLPVGLPEAQRVVYLNAHAGDPACQVELGGYYETGAHGFAQSKQEAARWYHQAAQSPHPKFKANFKLFLETGRGTAGWKMAATQRDAVAMVRVARGHELGVEGFELDPVIAAQWYRLASSQDPAARQKAIELFSTRTGSMRTKEVLSVIESKEPLVVPPNKPKEDLKADRRLFPNRVGDRDFHLARLLIHRNAITRIHREQKKYDTGLSDPWSVQPRAASDIWLSELQVAAPEFKDLEKDQELFPTKTDDLAFHLERIQLHQKALARTFRAHNEKGVVDDGAIDAFLQWGTSKDPKWRKEVDELFAKRTQLKK